MYGITGSNNRKSRQPRRSSSTSRNQRQLDRKDSAGQFIRKSLYSRFLDFIRVAWTGVKFALDSDIGDHDCHPRYRPESLESLAQLTRFSPHEIKRLYRGFKAECPTGVAQQETLCEIYSKFFPQGANTSTYAHYFFNSFDQERSGVINFEEFIRGLSVMARGSLTEKLIWTFNLYDINGDGCITREEMSQIVTSIFQLMGHHNIPATDLSTTHDDQEHLVHDRVDRIFQKMDRNSDGVVTLDEFLDWCSHDENVTNSINAIDSFV